jgi:hypothetical protein
MRRRSRPSAWRTRVGAEEEVTCVQPSLEVPNYRGAIRFHNGKEVLLQRLPVGQQLDVLGFASAAEAERLVAQAVERRTVKAHATV